MQYLLAFLPILIVLGVMLFLRWGGHQAGPLGWVLGLLIAWLFFGLDFDVFWISQVKGLLLSVFALFILWPALLLYNVVDQIGGIKAIAAGLEQAVGERGLLLIILAWAFSGALEGLAGFGLPIAVVAPMLVGLGVSPVAAVAAVAVGHSWSVTLGDMGVVFETLSAVVELDAAYLAPTAALMLAGALVLCGLGAALILKQGRYWYYVLGLGLLMSVTQYFLAVIGLIPLAALGAGLVGVLGGVLIGQFRRSQHGGAVERDDARHEEKTSRALRWGLLSYGSLALLMALLALIEPLRTWLAGFHWQVSFPAIMTETGRQIPASKGVNFAFFLHPGSSILLIALLSYAFFKRISPGESSFRKAFRSTWHAAAPVSLGVISMVGLSAVMEACGMTLLLARGLSDLLGALFPLVSPAVGVLGAFATGSNNNSNVLFAPLQKSAAAFLGMEPRVLLAAQTTGGSLGSMIAPAKIIVGCSTVGLTGKEGEVLRITLIYCAVICLILGGLALLF